jgi:ADP-heptose:LPS heptosyltransferase
VKIPLLDGLVRWGVMTAHRAGVVRTAAAWTPGDLDRADGILIVISTALGDSVCCTPMLEALRLRAPRARLVGFYHAAFAPMYADDPRLDAMIPYHGKYRRVGETIRALRRARCGIALLAHIAEPDVVPLVWLGGSRILLRMAGRDTVYRRMMANPDLLATPQTNEHAVRRGLRTIEALGGPHHTAWPTLPVSDASRGRVARWLEQRGVVPGWVRVGIHPGASVANKRWPAEHYVALGRRLLAGDPALCLLLTGAPGEAGLVRRIAAEIGEPGRVIEAAGALGIADLPALIAGLDLLVSADTGVAHIAHATGTSSVTLFWRSDPALVGPIHDLDRHAVIARQPLCPPCRTRSCRYPDCANEITVERVLEVARATLSRPAVAGRVRTLS